MPKVGIHMSEGTLEEAIQHHCRCISCFLTRGQFVSLWTHENRLMYAKLLLNELKQAQGQDCHWFNHDQKWIQAMADGYTWTSQSVGKTMFCWQWRTHHAISNSSYSFLYFPTGQALKSVQMLMSRLGQTVVNPCIDRLTAKGRVHVFLQQCLRLSPTKDSLKVQDWMVENIHNHIVPTYHLLQLLLVLLLVLTHLTLTFYITTLITWLK